MHGTTNPKKRVRFLLRKAVGSLAWVHWPAKESFSTVKNIKFPIFIKNGGEVPLEVFLGPPDAAVWVSGAAETHSLSSVRSELQQESQSKFQHKIFLIKQLYFNLFEVIYWSLKFCISTVEYAGSLGCYALSCGPQLFKGRWLTVKNGGTTFVPNVGKKFPTATTPVSRRMDVSSIPTWEP
jgi:hypothetical protein